MEDFLRDQFHVFKTRVRKIKEKTNATKVLTPEEKEVQDRKAAEAEALRLLREEIRNMAREDTLSLAVEIPYRTKQALRNSSTMKNIRDGLLQDDSTVKEENLLVDGMQFRFGLITGFKRYRQSAEFLCSFDTRPPTSEEEEGSLSGELSSVVQALAIRDCPIGVSSTEGDTPRPLLILTGHDDYMVRLWQAEMSADPDVGYHYEVKQINEYAGNKNKVLDVEIGTLNWLRYIERVKRFEKLVEEDKELARERTSKRMEEVIESGLVDRKGGQKASNSGAVQISSIQDSLKTKSIVSSEVDSPGKTNHSTETNEHKTIDGEVGANATSQNSNEDGMELLEHQKSGNMMIVSDSNVEAKGDELKSRVESLGSVENLGTETESSNTTDESLRKLLHKHAKDVCDKWNKELERDESVAFEFVTCCSDGTLKIWKLNHAGEDVEPEWLLVEKEEEDLAKAEAEAEAKRLEEEKLDEETLAKRRNPINQLVAKVRQDRIIAEQLLAARNLNEEEDSQIDTYPECRLETTPQIVDDHDNIVYSVCISPNQEFIFSSSADGSVRKWDAKSLEEIYRYDAHTGSATCCAISPDGKYLVTGGDHQDPSLKLWDATITYDLERESKEKSETFFDALDNPSMFQALFLGEASENPSEAEEEKEPVVPEMRPSHRPSLGDALDDESAFHVGLLDSAEPSTDVHGLVGPTTSSIPSKSLGILPNSNIPAAISDLEGNIGTQKERSKVPAAALSDLEGNTGTSSVHAATSDMHDNSTTPKALGVLPEELSNVPGGGSPVDASLHRPRRHAVPLLLGSHAGGRGLLSAGVDSAEFRAAQLLQARRSGGHILTFFGSKSSFDDRPHIDWVNQVKFSHDGKQVASVSSDKTVKLWQPTRGLLEHTFVGHTDWVLGCDFAPKGPLLASCAADTTILLWDTATKTRYRRIFGHYDAVCKCVFTSNAMQIVSSSYDGTIRIWGLGVSKPGRPGTPRVVHATEYDMLLEWRAPVANGADITQYRICGRPLGKDRSNGDKEFEFKELALVDLQPHEYTKARVSQLHPGWMYEMTVAAKNQQGWGPTSAPSKARRCLPDVPSQPGQPVTVETTTNSARLLWIGPDSMGSHITHFLLQLRGGAYQSFDSCEPRPIQFNEAKLAGERVRQAFEKLHCDYTEKASNIPGFVRSLEGKELKKKLIEQKRLRLQVTALKKQLGGGLEMYGDMDGLIPGIMYQFRLCAVNREGQGPYSLPSISEITKSTVPERVDTIESREPSLYSILLRWVPPFANGSVIQHYDICFGRKGLVDRYIAQREELARIKGQVEELRAGKVAPLQRKAQARATGLSRTGLLELKDRNGLAEGAKTVLFACLMLLDDRLHDLESLSRLHKALAKPTQLIDRLVKYHAGLFTLRGLLTDDLPAAPIRPLAREVLRSIVEDPELHPDVLGLYSPEVGGLAAWLCLQHTLHDLLEEWAPALRRYRSLHETFVQVTERRLMASRVTVQGSSSQYVFEDLEPNTSYRFMVCARNSHGPGPYSPPTAALRTLKDVPTAPTHVVAFNPSPVSLNLSWRAARPCGSTITTYQVAYRIDRVGKYIDPPVTFSTEELGLLNPEDPAKGFQVTVWELLPLCQFEFKVRAGNSQGFGEWSAASDPFFTLPAKVPEAPSLPLVDGLTPSTCWLRWEQPETNGSKIESYVVHFDENETGNFVHKQTTEAGVASKQQSCLIKNLTHHVPYRFKVAAVNEVGMGEFGTMSESVVLPSEIEYIMTSSVPQQETFESH